MSGVTISNFDSQEAAIVYEFRADADERQLRWLTRWLSVRVAPERVAEGSERP